MAAEIWQPKTVGWVWLTILGVSLAAYGGIVMAGGGPLAMYYAAAVPGAMISGLIVYSLIRRGTHGWGWIPIGLALALTWGVVWLLLQALIFLLTTNRYSRRRW